MHPLSTPQITLFSIELYKNICPLYIVYSQTGLYGQNGTLWAKPVKAIHLNKSNV